MLSSCTNQKFGTIKNDLIIKRIREYFMKLKPKKPRIISKSLPNQSLDKDYYKTIKDNSALTVIISNIKAKEIRIKNYHLKNILI